VADSPDEALTSESREPRSRERDSARGPKQLTRRAWLTRYVRRRLLILVPLAFVATVAAFGLTKLAPGGPVAAMLQDHPTSPAQIAEIRHRYRLDDPLVSQYWHWLSGIVHGDFGRSIITNDTVLNEVERRLSVTLTLNLGGIVFAVLFGIPLGVLAAMHRTRPADQAIVGLSIFGTSTPPFASGIAFLYLLGFKLGWFPLFGEGSGFLGHVRHLSLPVIVLGLHGMGFVMRITRAAMLNQLDQDFIPFAQARGLSARRVVVRYALRNALIPVVTAAGLLFIGLLTGSVLVESVFGLPGLGTLLVDAVVNGDFPVIQGLVLIIASWIIVVNLLVDLTYAAVDPRVGFEAAHA
jgi:peptide/nickel transport system permease protein